MKSKKKRLFLCLIIAVISIIIIAIAVNLYMVIWGENRIVFKAKDEELAFSKELESKIEDLDPDCILVMGAGITDSETPTPMLKERLDTAIALYKAGLANRILLSGDNGREGHNEIHVMLSYTKEQGVPPDKIFCDHAGFNTSQTMCRAYNIFGVKRAIIVTQTYHEYRCLFDAEKAGIEAVGVSSDQEKHVGGFYRNAREVLARCKDFFRMGFTEVSYTGGEKFDLKGDGRETHGE